MNKPFKPMTASKATEKQLKQPSSYPVIATVKMDGIRVVVVDGKATVRSGASFPNLLIRNWLEKTFKDVDVDGEMYIHREFNRCSGLCRRTKNAEFPEEMSFFIFDFDMLGKMAAKENTYIKRLQLCEKWLEETNQTRTLQEDHFIREVRFVSYRKIRSYLELCGYEKEVLEKGYEGLVLRSIGGKYKEGRSSPKTLDMSKVKRFTEEEGVILEVYPRRKNIGERKVDELGYSRTNSCQGDFVETERIGGCLVASSNWKEPFYVSMTAFTELDQKALWKSREELIGRSLTFKYFSTEGFKKPRHPIGKGVRWDL